MSNAGDPEQPRQPRNLQGLLKFAMECKVLKISYKKYRSPIAHEIDLSATKAEDPTVPSHFQHMSAEDRAFLEAALKSMTVDTIEELNKAMKTLTEGTNTSEDEQVEALEVVTSFVADIDTANGKLFIRDKTSLMTHQYLFRFLQNWWFLYHSSMFEL